MNKLKALLVTLFVAGAALVAPSTAVAAGGDYPICEGVYPYTNAPCKVTILTYGPEGNAGPLYTLTYVYNKQGNTRILWSETTLPKN